MKAYVEADRGGASPGRASHFAAAAHSVQPFGQESWRTVKWYSNLRSISCHDWINAYISTQIKKPRARRAERGVWNHKPRQYTRGKGEMATGAADQAARRLSAEDLPVRRSATTSNETFCPSLRLCIPARSTALICTKTSWPPSSGWMKPKPFWPLNHFTVPCAMETSFRYVFG